jgi:hypothetical protein
MKSHPYAWLKVELGEAFLDCGFIETKEALSPDDFGSAYSEWSNTRREIRLIWDGKEGCALLELKQNGSWSALVDPLTEADLEGREINTRAVQRWKEAIVKLEQGA